MPRTLLLPLALFLPFTACATPPQHTPTPTDTTPTTDTTTTTDWSDRILIDTIALPFIWLRPDQPNRINPTERIDDMTGPGLGLRTAVGNAEESIGLLYTGMFVDDESTSTELDAHALYVDFDTTLTLPDGPQGLALRAAAGLGVASMGFGDARFDDVQTGAANLRIDMQFAPTPGLALGFGVGGFVYGFPGETEAYGSFMQLGLRLTF